MKLTAFILAALLSAPAAAEVDCILIAKVAEKIMEHRQQNMTTTQILDMVEEPEAIRDMVILAYRQPLEKSKERKQEAVVEFGLLFLKVCAESEKEQAQEGIRL